MKIELGQKVKCKLSGYKGTAVCRAEWLFGCVRISVQGSVDKDGKIPALECFDEEQLEVIEPEIVIKHDKAKPSAGPRPSQTRNPDPTR
jgi:hypothetical protein